MGGGTGMLLVGFLAGGAVASVVWAVIVLGRRRAADAQKAEREQIMASVGETLAEADAIETNFRSGALTPEAFRQHLGDRINAVMRILRTNMHILDAYFVKYAEQEARDYLRVIDNPERRKLDGHDLPAPPMPGAVDKSAMYEPPLSVPPPPQPVIADTPNKYEHPPAAPAPVAVDTSHYYEPLPAPAPISAAGVSDEFEPPPPPAPTPEPSVSDTAGSYELPPSAPSVADTADDFEPPAAAPAPIAPAADTEDDFEPAFAPPTPQETATLYGAPQGAPVREEELVLGESPEDMSVTFNYNPAPAPIFAPPPPPPVMPPPAPVQASDSEWSGGESIEEFEAAFEQFEPASQTPPNRQASDHDLTETSSIDRSAILNAMAASGQLPSVQTPLSVPLPPQPPESPEPPQTAPANNEHQGITGDDVADSIDNLFNLK